MTNRPAFTADSETQTWDEQRFEKLLRLAAALQGTLPGASVAGQAHDSSRVAPVRARIESRAYELFVSRGGADGGDLDDWLCAEREIRAIPSAVDPRLRLVLAFGLLKGL